MAAFGLTGPQAYPFPGVVSRITSADGQQIMLQKPVGVGLDQCALQKAIAPGRGNRGGAVVRARELAAGRGCDVRIATVIGSVQHRVAEIAGGGERLERDAERIGDGVIATARLPLAGTRRGAARRRLGPCRSRDRRKNARLRLTGQRQKEARARSRQAPRTAGAWQVVRAASLASCTASCSAAKKNITTGATRESGSGIELMGSMRAGEALAAPVAPWPAHGRCWR